MVEKGPGVQDDRTEQAHWDLTRFDYKRFSILYVDDEQKSLQTFVREFERMFRILTAANAVDALRIVEARKHEIALVMTDLRMPGNAGRWLLEAVGKLNPRLIRILVSTFSSASGLRRAVISANCGEIYTYVVKPWETERLEHTLKRALEYFCLRQEIDRLY